MTVIARTDPHAAHQDVFDRHPDWIAIGADGRKLRHPVMPELWTTCALGPYNFEFMTEVTKEIVSLYKVDGVFSNRWAGSGMCYCEHCRENFRAAAGLDLPRATDPQDPARRAYIGWRQQRLFDLWKLWDSEIRKINPAARFIPNTGGGALADLDMKTIGERADILFADRQARSGLTPAWANGKNGKEYRSTMGGKPIGGIFSVGVEEPYRWKDSVQSGPEIRLWALDGIANGLRPWFTKFGGVRSTTGAGCRWWKISTPGTIATSDTCETSGRWRGWVRLFAADGALLRRSAGAAEGGGPHAGLLPGADRGAHSFRNGTRQASGRRPYRASSPP